MLKSLSVAAFLLFVPPLFLILIWWQESSIRWYRRIRKFPFAMHISPVGRICGTCGKLPLFLQFSVYQSPISQKESEEARERRRVPAKYVKSLSRSNSIKSVTIRNDNEIWRDPVLFDEKKYGLELTDALLGLSIEKLSLEVGCKFTHKNISDTDLPEKVLWHSTIQKINFRNKMQKTTSTLQICTIDLFWKVYNEVHSNPG